MGQVIVAGDGTQECRLVITVAVLKPRTEMRSAFIKPTAFYSFMWYKKIVFPPQKFKQTLLDKKFLLTKVLLYYKQNISNKYIVQVKQILGYIQATSLFDIMQF